MQFNIGQINSDGVYTGENETIALCGFIRAKVCLGVVGERHTHSHVCMYQHRSVCVCVGG